MNETTIICPHCYQPLTKDNTGELGALQPECNDCRKKFGIKPNIIERYAKLLEFVKSLSENEFQEYPFSLDTDLYGDKYKEVFPSDILKEIGEE